MSLDNPDVSFTHVEYNALKKDNIFLKKELENKKQELYVFKRNIQLMEALQNDYKSEVELLQSTLDAEKNTLQKKICQLEEYNNSLKLNVNEQICSLEVNLSKYEEENLLLRNAIEMLKKSHKSFSESDAINKLNDNIYNLKSENRAINEKSEELKVFLESLQKQNTILEETLSEAKQEIDELQKSLTCKKEELIEANEIVDQLNEELIFMRNELETYKNQPLEKGSQGNSLFAEVDDRRVHLQKMVNNMKQEYLAMKQERAKHMREIHHLKIENRTLLEKWRADVNEKDDDHYTELKALKGRIGVLENLLEDHKEDLNKQQIPSTQNSFDGFEFYLAMINNKNKQIEDLREQLSSRTLREVLLSKALTEANEEKRKWKLEAAMKSNELELLQIGKNDPESNFNETTSNSSEKLNNLAKIKMTKDGKQDHLQKLNETENNTSRTKVVLESNVTMRAEHLKLHKNVNSEMLSKNQEVLENVVTGTKNSENDPMECSKSSNQKITNNNMCVDLLDGSSDARVISNKIEETIKTEVEHLAIKKENVITEDNSEDDVILKSSSDDNANENKENLPCDSRIDIEISGNSKKVTFSESTVSPKKTALRKCKKVMVAKPVLFISSLK